MGLERYKEKRSSGLSPEPEGGKAERSGLIFTVQKHEASRLHYDFRLEMEGVLKSWAVPKGPSADPKIKRLAMMVEDHPYDYRNFEGIIPQGQYGGGTVIVWDQGTYEAEGLQGKSKKEQEKYLLEALEQGNLKFILNGTKLKGSYALVKINGKGENEWLLIKHNDSFASKGDITLKEGSVLSGKTIEQMKGASGSDGGQELSLVSKKKASLKENKKSAFPSFMKPMLATLTDEPFDDDGWICEVKWDGYRTLALLNKGEVSLLSRNEKPFDDKFYPIYQLCKELDMNAIFDGEIVVINEQGISDFSRLQNWRSEADGHLVYYVFDLLWHEGKDLTDLPLSERQALLKKVLPEGNDQLRLSTVFTSGAIEFFKAATQTGLEGIIAKKLSSIYTPGYRSKEWLKVKVHKRQEVVIAGFTKNKDTVKEFSSLLLGIYENKDLVYVGKVGTGFSQQDQHELMAAFKPFISKESPFNTVPDINKPSRFRPVPAFAKAVWLRPELVCEVSFAEVTPDGVFRHPSFMGIRIDKKAGEVIREVAVPAALLSESLKMKEHLKPAPEISRKSFLNPKDESQVRNVCGHDLKFTHLSKVYWPAEGITKRELLNYYYQVAEFILPYLKDRPQSLNRFPAGIGAKGFYQKDISRNAPEWAKRFPHTTNEGEHKEYLVGGDEATLLWMASLGCIEMNPWFSRVQSPDFPDYCVIDLDPDKNTFDQVVKAALEVKKVLDGLGIPSFPKTSGSTGMHIYIPLGGEYTYDQSQLFAKLIVKLVHEQIPEFTSLERLVKNREGKMYLDFLQNRPGATIAGAYSLRPKPGATVSMPLNWDEVKKGLKMEDFTIHTALNRLKSEGDLFKGVLGKGIDLEKTVKLLES